MISVGTPQEAIREDGMALDAAMKSLALSKIDLRDSMRRESDPNLTLHLTNAIYEMADRNPNVTDSRLADHDRRELKQEILFPEIPESTIGALMLRTAEPSHEDGIGINDGDFGDQYLFTSIELTAPITLFQDRANLPPGITFYKDSTMREFKLGFVDEGGERYPENMSDALIASLDGTDELASIINDFSEAIGVQIFGAEPSYEQPEE